MKISTERILPAGAKAVALRCNHPSALIVDPTEKQLEQLETMLAQCPNCSRWMPGDGPIMAVISTQTGGLSRDPNNKLM